jgi:threonylcarbamoyladenosine tRNA methylthiotransferase MtaB
MVTDAPGHPDHRPDRSAARPAVRPAVRRAAIANLGCKVNQSEMEAAARLLRSRGVAVVDADEPADIVLVNTCTVTAEADATSRHALRRARRASPDAEILVTGCSVQVGRAAFAAVDPDARLVDNRAKDALLADIEAMLGPAPSAPGAHPVPNAPGLVGRPLPTLSGVEIEGIADGRASVERTRAFIKVQDGCSFFCTYCIIPAARGPERSVPATAVLADVRRALAAGHREIVLTGINIGTYDGGWSERGFRGAHVRAALSLAGLVRRILGETDVERIRVSSIEPQHVDDELLRVWVDGAPRTMPHVHLPLQSGDDGVLRRMGRRYRSAEYAAIVARIRAAISGAAIHGDTIVGFPTEDGAAWRRSLAFIEDVDFAGLHVFRYSARPGTAATRMAGQVDEVTKKARARELLAVAADARARWAASRVGGVSEVLFERRLDDGRWVGHATDHTLVAVERAAVDLAGDPGGDPAAGAALLENAIGRVAIEAVDPSARDRVIGRILALSPPPGAPTHAP